MTGLPKGPMNKIDILIVDDHTILRDGLVSILSSVTEFNIVGQCENGTGIVHTVHKLNPQVVLLDISLPGENGIDVLKELKKESNRPKVIILSMHVGKQYILAALRNGAMGFISKQIDSENLIRAIHSVAEGKLFVDLVATRALTEPDTKPLPETGIFISSREKQILHFIGKGLTSKEIGKRLFISHRTVEKHRQNIMDKLGIHSMAKLVAFALEQNI